MEVDGPDMPQLAAYLFLVSVLLMVLLTPLANHLARRMGVVDIPGPRKIHLSPIPLSGGWAIFATISIVLWGHLGGAYLVRATGLEAQLPETIRTFVERVPDLLPKILPFYAGAVSIFAIGLFDDLKGMSVKSRLLVQFLLAAALAVVGLRPSLGFLPSWLGTIVGILWIVGITNAFNFLDGLDGLSTGVALVGTSVLLTVMGSSNQPHVVHLLAVLAGTQLGFLRFNFHPATCFLGSSGSLLLGYLLGTTTILVTFLHQSSSNWMMPLLTPVFILAIPIYDTTSVVLIRLLQNRNIAIGDQSHFHHRLLRLGFSHRQTVVFIVLIALAVALSGVRLVTATLGGSFLILFQILVIMSILILAERVAARVRTEFHERKKEETPLVLTKATQDQEQEK